MALTFYRRHRVSMRMLLTLGMYIVVSRNGNVNKKYQERPADFLDLASVRSCTPFVSYSPFKSLSVCQVVLCNADMVSKCLYSSIDIYS
jgi:hypothetical protein